MEMKNISQGSNEWHEMRKRSVTSTDAPIINGTNTFRGNSPYKLWQKKLDLIDLEPITDVMTEGLNLEGAARNWFNHENKVLMVPAVTYHKDYEWLIASLDGYSEDVDFILEIKGGEKAYQQATDGVIPTYYYDQIQHALFASGKNKCMYIAYRIDKKPIVIPVERNEEYISNLLEKEKEFYECLITMTPPVLTDKDFIIIESEEANSVALKWKDAKERLDAAKAWEAKVRQELLDETDDGSCIFESAKVKIERISCKGTVDWKKVCKKWGIQEAELEVFRKQSIGYPRITVIDQKGSN